MTTEAEMISKIILALILGLVIGFEREESHKPAGLRTHVLVCMGAALATIISMDYFSQDYARIAAGMITGMGFLGAGTIIALGRDVKGITTAASLWTVAIIGMAVGVGAYTLSIVTTFIIFIVLTMGRFEKIFMKKTRKRK